MAASSATLRSFLRTCSKPAAKTIAVFVMLTLLAGACTGSSAGQIVEPPTVTGTTVAETATPTATAPAVETPTPETPTVEPTPAELTDEERITAAIAEFEANPQPEGLFAYDILDTGLSGNGVIISLCAWTGETVFDQVRQATYRVDTEPDANGEPDVTFESTTETPGDCLNTTLVESALQTTRDYDKFWGAVLDDPTTFNREQASQHLVEADLDFASDTAEDWNSNGLQWRGHALDGDLPDSSHLPVAWRRYELEDFDVFEAIGCRELAAGYGLYRGDLLVDNFKGPNAGGTQVIHKYQLMRTSNRWLIAGVDSTVWADCFASEWLPGLNDWQPEPTEWALLS